ncbi:hypothetical protein G6F68_016767 [Rhizopus microsporus]|nr:hypothetical protein G6F68_016767 [Rhizopus microsporus]
MTFFSSDSDQVGRTTNKSICAGLGDHGQLLTLDQKGLACQTRLINHELRVILFSIDAQPQQSSVCWDNIADPEHNHVTRDQFFHVHLFQLIVTVAAGL